MSTGKYYQYAFIPIRFADPISAMQVKDNHLMFGTMMGRITNFEIAEKKNILLEESSRENISDISFDPNGNCDVGIGDEKVYRYTFIPNAAIKDNKPRYQKFDLYSSPSEHNSKCENCYTMLSHGAMFKVQLCQPDEGNVVIAPHNADIEFKDKINGGERHTKKLEMTNYSVPLDFFDNKFVWVEYLSEVERKFCVVNLQSDIQPYKQILNKSFGHISHCKMLRDGTVFLVRSLNKCEIRRLDDTFSLVTDFTHIGEEVYAVDIVYDDEIQAAHLGPGGECIQIQVAGRVEEIKVKPGEKNEVIDSAENNNEYSNNFNQEGAQNQMNLTEEKKDDIKYTIVLLDIDGGVNTYRDGNIQQEFNLYDIENIEQDQKDKQFFSLGYAYYIKYDGNYFCISSDHGCYVITNTDNK